MNEEGFVYEADLRTTNVYRSKPVTTYMNEGYPEPLLKIELVDGVWLVTVKRSDVGVKWDV